MGEWADKWGVITVKAKCWQKKVLNKWRGWERGTATDNRYVTLSRETPPLLTILPLPVPSFFSSWEMADIALGWLKRDLDWWCWYYQHHKSRWQKMERHFWIKAVPGECSQSNSVLKYSLKSLLSLRFSVFFRIPPSSDRFIVVYLLGKGRCFDQDVPHLGREMEIRPSVEISKRQTLAGLRWC